MHASPVPQAPWSAEKGTVLVLVQLVGMQIVPAGKVHDPLPGVLQSASVVHVVVSVAGTQVPVIPQDNGEGQSPLEAHDWPEQ